MENDEIIVEQKVGPFIGRHASYWISGLVSLVQTCSENFKGRHKNFFVQGYFSHSLTGIMRWFSGYREQTEKVFW